MRRSARLISGPSSPLFSPQGASARGRLPLLSPPSLANFVRPNKSLSVYPLPQLALRLPLAHRLPGLELKCVYPFYSALVVPSIDVAALTSGARGRQGTASLSPTHRRRRPAPQHWGSAPLIHHLPRGTNGFQRLSPSSWLRHRHGTPIICLHPCIPGPGVPGCSQSEHSSPGLSPSPGIPQRLCADAVPRQLWGRTRLGGEPESWGWDGGRAGIEHAVGGTPAPRSCLA